MQAVQFPNGETYVYSAPLWSSDIASGRAKLLKGKEAETALRDYHRAELLQIVKPGDTLTTVCTHHSRTSGASRFKVFIPSVDRDGRPCIRNITRLVAALAGFRLSKDDEIVMGGDGYSKSFQIGYSLGCCLWPNGTDHPHGTRNGKPDSDGGYAINVNGF